MDRKRIEKLVADIRAGRAGEDDAVRLLAGLPFADLGHTKVDHHRALRQGQGEVIFAPGKQSAQIVAIMKEMVRIGSAVLVTRLDPDQMEAVKKAFKKALVNEIGRTARLPARGAKKPKPPAETPVLVLSGGTADQAVVQEAMETLAWMGVGARSIPDVGVAGIHRLFAFHKDLTAARVIIVVAGMEGALASVVGGLTDKAVIGVPVSVGYGAGGGGVAPLLAMLNSCASGVTVVNIDNGFGAAFAAARALKAGGPK
jgi:hypothetical protein